MTTRGIFALLTGEPTITALCPGGVHWIELPKGTTAPAITFQRIMRTSKPTFATSGMQRLRVQFNCWGPPGDESAALLQDALVTFLDGYRGALADGTFVQNAELIGVDQDQQDQDSRQFKVMSEFYFWFTLND